MEDHHQGQAESNSPRNGSERSEPVRSRWTPKPEQILILESIFNSGMVNPPKDETVRIRKLLEKFGSVGDANVFYWFQNRRSRSRRRQRQLQATLAGDHHQHQQQQRSQPHIVGGGVGGDGVCGGGGAIQYENHTGGGMGYGNNSHTTFAAASAAPLFVGSSSSSFGDDGIENLMSTMSGQMGFQEIGQNSSVTSVLCPSETSSLHYQSGFMTVFINGVATEVPRGPLDMKAMFGEDVMLVHSSGIPLPINEFGFVLQSLQPGESYFLVSSYGR